MARSVSEPWITIDSTLCIDPDRLLSTGLLRLPDEPDIFPIPLLVLRSRKTVNNYITATILVVQNEDI